MPKVKTNRDNAWNDLIKCADKYARVLKRGGEKTEARTDLDEAIADLKNTPMSAIQEKKIKQKNKKTRRKSS
jgi:hypothetical protein